MATSSRQPTIKPIQLLTFDSEKRLVLSNEAISVFQGLEAQQLHIITVAGKYRTGKSYILNRVLLNQNSGFEVGPTINACTKGLWMWPAIVEIDANGAKKKCIVVDTQGLGSLEEGENTDIKIFLMAVLLSSYLIYNSVGSIDEKAMENLSLIVNLAEMLHKNENQYDSQELINSFPSFLWLVRDFSLRLETEKGESMSSQQYLQNALKYQNSTSQAAQRKNSIRKKLKTFFQDRNCFTLVRPTENEKDLQNLSSLHERKLRPEFVKLICELKQLISSNLKPKKVRGKTITPQGFIELCKYFVQTINSGKLPSINSHWDNLCLKEASRIMERNLVLIVDYVSQHKVRLSSCCEDCDEIDEKYGKIEAVHKKVLKEANDNIDKSFLGKLEKQLCKQKIQKAFLHNYDQCLKQINDNRYSIVKDIVKDIFMEIMEEFQDKKLESFEQIFARFEEIKQKYKHDTRIYQSFYENSKDVFQQFLRSLKQHWQREQLILNQKNCYLEAVVAQKTQQLKQQILQSGQRIRQMESSSYRIELQNSQLQSMVSDLKTELINSKQENEILRDAMEQMQLDSMQTVAEEMEVRIGALQEHIAELQAKLHHTQIQVVKYREQNKEYAIKERKTVREMEIFKNKCSEYLKENIQVNEKIERLNKKLMEVEQDKRMGNIKDKLDSGDFITALNSQINELQIKLKTKQEENKNISNMLNGQKIAYEALMRAPQTLSYTTLRKNYEIELQSTKSLKQKISCLQVSQALFSHKCLLCHKCIDKASTHSHLQTCVLTKSVCFDVSYEYNGNGDIQFVIDVFVDDEQWTIRKSLLNVRLLLKKRGIQAEMFTLQRDELDDDGGEERRAFLDQLFNQYREQVLLDIDLVQFFCFDLHYLSNTADKMRNSMTGSMKGSKVSLDFDSILEENIDPIGNSSLLMKTGKFSKKTFNFSNL